jgi:hypothetical protein
MSVTLLALRLLSTTAHESKKKGGVLHQRKKKKAISENLKRFIVTIYKLKS